MSLESCAVGFATTTQEAGHAARAGEEFLKGPALFEPRVGNATRNCYIKNVVLFEDNSILPLPGCLEASGVESVWGEGFQDME